MYNASIRCYTINIVQIVLDKLTFIRWAPCLLDNHCLCLKKSEKTTSTDYFPAFYFEFIQVGQNKLRMGLKGLL